MSERIPKRQIVHRSVVLYEIAYRKRRELNLETHVAFIDYVKVFDNVKRDKLFEILRSKNAPNLLLKV